MRFNNLLLITLLTAASSSAQNKINLNGIRTLETIETETRSRGTSTAGREIETLVMMNDGWNDSVLKKYSARIVTEVSDDILVISLPVDNVIAFSNDEDVKYVEFGDTYHTAMNMARPAGMVSTVQSGFEFNGASVSFDGTGVVTGLMDSGIDPNHPAFLDSNGEPRVKEAYDYLCGLSATTPEAVKQFATEDAAQTHGTHVAGIMAGKSYGKGDYCIIPNPDGGETNRRYGNIPFYGVATGSDIVMSGGTLNSTNIVKGATAVQKYAEAHGKPFVVNLSISSLEGPHDGTGVVTEAFARIGKKGLVCVAAGNDGASKLFVGKTFTAADNVIKTFVQDNKFDGADIWTNSSQPVTVTLSLYNDGQLQTLAETNAANQTASLGTSADFQEYMDGYAEIKSEVNILNKRYHVSVKGVITPRKDGRRLVLSIKGQEGQRVYCYGTGPTLFTDYSIPGYTDGTANGSISDLATGKNIITVGSFTSSNSSGTFAGTYHLVPRENYPINQVSPFSSYGYNYKETALPTVCAPGCWINSSLNRYYTKGIDAETLKSQTSASMNGSLKAYWGPMSGTSMATPYIAGTIALWLQADPTLAYKDVLDIIEKTSVKPQTTDSEESIRWGAGRIDALAGIKEVLSRNAAGLQGVIADETLITFDGLRTINISTPSAAGVSAMLYNMQGIKVAGAETSGTDVSVDATGLASGVYLLSIETSHNAPVTRRILLK